MNYTIPQSTVNRLVARWINSKFGRLETRRRNDGIFYRVFTKKDNPMFNISFEGEDVYVEIFPESFGNVYDTFPQSIHFSNIIVGLKEYIKNPNIRGFSMDDDPKLTDNTSVTVFSTPLK